MKKILTAGLVAGALVFMAGMNKPVQGSGKSSSAERNKAEAQEQYENYKSKVQQGLAIAPVPLQFQQKNRALVGLGSYIVNAQGACNDCHSCPSFAPGHSPYTGGDGLIDTDHYLAGGVPFGPFIKSANITPDETGKPAGLTLEKFIHTIRTGEDPEEAGRVLLVMPWPSYRFMTDRDLQAVYEYLSAIPHAEPGTECAGAGQ